MRGKAKKSPIEEEFHQRNPQTIANRILLLLSTESSTGQTYGQIEEFVFKNWIFESWLPRLELNRALTSLLASGLVARNSTKKTGLKVLWKAPRPDSAYGENTWTAEDRFCVTDAFVAIRELLDFSTRTLAQRYDTSILVDPIFGATNEMNIDVFVIIPFRAEMSPAYEVIRDVCFAKKLTVTRADAFYDADHIIQDIWSAIHSAEYIICDCTLPNPNVYYELGIAHTLGKAVTLVAAKGTELPFDLTHWRVTFYDRELMHTQLDQAIQNVVSR